ncbi:MAG: NADH-quinone oxidoreductase subunit J [Actinobacteria bacterium]|nr:NADH-quinone oxidoreductase subunit J [Actinomycetota bacterium]MBW3646730.1 NADH-quinone oxidoreductase subunit J [Actinomycetota bacterium]
MVVDALFWLLALTAVASGFAVFRVSSMARATFALAVSFVAVGAVMLLLDLDYLGLITVLMMVMEMSIMAVFMIMYMMNPGGLMPMSMYHNKAGAMTVAVGSFVVLAAGALLVPWPEREGVAPADITLQLGEGIMGSKMLVMLTISPVLFATIVGSLVLAAPRGRYDRFGDDLDQPASDPVPGGLGR